MVDYKCSICFNIQQSGSVPEICNSCGSKYIDWVNLNTNEIERVKTPAKTVTSSPEPEKTYPSEPPEKHKPLKTFVTKKSITPKVVVTPPHKSAGFVLTRKSGLSFSRNNITVNVPMGRNCKETVLIRNLDIGKVSGKVTSDSYFVKPKPDVFSFNKYLFLNISIETKTIITPLNKYVTVKVESSSGDYDIDIRLNVIKTSFWGGFKYIFKPW
jgi:hypothetical protein